MVLAFFTSEPCRRGAILVDHESTEPDPASTLSSAANVCQDWYQPAIEALYRSVRLGDGRVCVLFARTLQNATLARIVLSIDLARDIHLSCGVSKRHKRASKWLGRIYETNQLAISQAVGRILAAAVNLQNLRGPFGDVGRREEDIALVRLGIASKLRCLCARYGAIRRATWTGAPGWVDGSGGLFFHLLVRPTTLIWSNLHTLVVDGFTTVFCPAEVDATRLAEAFPVLRELVISRSSTDTETLNAVLSAFRNTLRTLSIWETVIGLFSRIEPLVYVEVGCEPGSKWREAFDNLEHLTCTGSTGYYKAKTSSICEIGTLTRLKSLSVPSDAVGEIAVLPQQLIRLVIHLPLRVKNVVQVSEEIENKLDTWIAKTPSLRQLVLSSSGYNREDTCDWPAQCLRLRHRLEACNIRISFETA